MRGAVEGGEPLQRLPGALVGGWKLQGRSEWLERDDRKKRKKKNRKTIRRHPPLSDRSLPPRRPAPPTTHPDPSTSIMEAVLSVAPFSAPCVLSFGSVYVGAVAERTVRVANPTEAAVVG